MAEMIHIILTEKIHDILKEMEKRMKKESGCFYGVKYALHDADGESKMENLRSSQ
jgi:hypothetical protein